MHARIDAEATCSLARWWSPTEPERLDGEEWRDVPEHVLDDAVEINRFSRAICAYRSVETRAERSNR